jgi:hypothetical protein
MVRAMRYVVLALLAIGCSKKAPPPAPTPAASATASLAPSASSSVIGTGPIEFQGIAPPNDLGSKGVYQHAHYGFAFRSSVAVTLTFEMVDRVLSNDEAPPEKRLLTRTLDLEPNKPRNVFVQMAWPALVDAGADVPRVSYAVDGEGASLIEIPPPMRNHPAWNIQTFGVSGPKRFEPGAWTRLIVTVPLPPGEASQHRLAPEVAIKLKDTWIVADKFPQPVLTFRVRATRR